MSRIDRNRRRETGYRTLPARYSTPPDLNPGGQLGTSGRWKLRADRADPGVVATRYVAPRS